MSDPRYPALYQINTRVWLTELSRPLGRRATLDDGCLTPSSTGWRGWGSTGCGF